MIARAAVGAVLLALAGCMPGGGGSPYRDAAAPIAATTRFEPARMAGRWDVVALFAEGDVAAPPPVTYAWDAAAEHLVVVPEADGPQARFAPLRVVAPGRLRPLGRDGVDDEIWVLWSDADYRTVVLSNRAGSFGQILNRGALAPDRLAAAREILDWYGFDLSLLRQVN
ncbi:lipocalin [Arenibacterium halophilum]|uniref:Lipocalin n=1 Tax=Arenibacterium halophilum TaxID=2583821 RepID=A0ABY2X8K7_9RHOB|nr:lipocalin [Arenibacterium halophilum]TMV12705.1 lipocalin [Arenibacterium halophilum]